MAYNFPINTNLLVANAVTNAKLAQMAANSIKINNTLSLANAIDGTITQVSTMLINDVGTGTTDVWSASKIQTAIDATNAGLSWKEAVIASSTQDLASESFGTTGVTYANGTAGVGATLTQNDATDGAFGSLDTISISQDDRVVIMDQSTGAENGIYTLTEIGNGTSTPWVLTRVIDADTSAELDSAAIFVQQGGTKGDFGYTQTASAATVGTTALTFVQFNGAANIIAGAGLTKSTNTLDVGAGNGITVNANDVTVKPDATGGANLAEVIDVNSNGVAVKVDDSTIEANGSAQLHIKDLGVTTGKIAADAVDKTKIAADVAGVGITQAAGGELDVSASVQNYTQAVKAFADTPVAAVSGDVLRVNTVAGNVLVNLPGSPDLDTVVIVSVKDVTNTLTVSGNGNNIEDATTATTQTYAVLSEVYTYRYDGATYWKS